MTRTTASALIAAALLLGACGGDDSDEGSDQGQQQQPSQPSQAKPSVLDCLDQSVLSPERVQDKADLPPGPGALITGKAQASAILGGDEFGAVVIEYPDAAASGKAYDKARESKNLGLKKDQIVVRNDVVFLDYSEDAHIGKVVKACIARPEQPPPTP